MKDFEMKPQPSEQTKKKNADTIISIVRFVGVYFVLVGLCLYFNLFGLGQYLFGDDIQTATLCGVLVAIIGLIDVFILPPILRKAMK